MKLNSRQIEAFSAVMKAGTVSRAAEILGVTQPGVSRLVAGLEKSLGFALFDRVRNRVVPTPEGRTFFEEVEANFRGMDRLRASAARIRDYGAGQLRVATLSALSSSIVPNAVLRFRNLRPDATVTLMVLSSRDVRDGVASGIYDIGLAADEIDVTGVVHQAFVQPRAPCAIPLGPPSPSARPSGRTTCQASISSPMSRRIARGSCSRDWQQRVEVRLIGRLRPDALTGPAAGIEVEIPANRDAGLRHWHRRAD